MNKTNRKWISQIVACSFLAMLPAGAYAQSKTIHGVVKDANGETIIGASVGQKGTKNATVTNLDGEFSISVPDYAELEISYIGCNNQRVAVNGKSSLEIVLTEDVHKLNELVVVGYGVMKKKDLTGAVGSLAARTWRTRRWLTSDRPFRVRLPVCRWWTQASRATTSPSRCAVWDR